MATWEGKAGTYCISNEAIAFFDVLLKHSTNSCFLEVGSFDGYELIISVKDVRSKKIAQRTAVFGIE
jgi:hypothetical protein